jgi:hypothetical protein
MQSQQCAAGKTMRDGQDDMKAPQLPKYVI